MRCLRQLFVRMVSAPSLLARCSDTLLVARMLTIFRYSTAMLITQRVRVAVRRVSRVCAARR